LRENHPLSISSALATGLTIDSQHQNEPSLILYFGFMPRFCVGAISTRISVIDIDMKFEKSSI